MKKLHINSLGAALSALVGAAMLVALGASPGAAQTATTTTTTAMGATTTTTQLSTPPIQGAGSHHIVIYMDTVTGGGTPKPLADCLEENQFVQGQLVVFRMWVDDSSAGGLAVTGSNSEAAYISIPGQPKLAMKYASDRGSPSYWEVPWSSKGYPVGTVNFTITVVAKPLAQWGLPQYAHSKVGAQAGVFSQKGFYSGSDLTIVAP
ncbi:MAG: hypothetical protein ABSA91_04860 [Acidimicrobiales bacterium]|jgi:hypothetical protein